MQHDRHLPTGVLLLHASTAIVHVRQVACLFLSSHQL